MKKIRKYTFLPILLKTELLKNTSVLITGTILAQAIPILLQPFLRRLFTPEAFGTYSVYLSLIGIITVISCLRYDDAIVLPQKDKESGNVLFLALLFNFIINFIIFLLILTYGKQVLHLLNLPATLTVSILSLIPAGAFLFNTYQAFNYWLIRKKKYYQVSLNKVARRGSEGAAQIPFGLSGVNNGLIFSDMIGQILNVSVALFLSIRNGFSYSLVSIEKLKYVLKKYSEFPKFNLIPALMSACSYYLPTLFINKFYSVESTGYFDLTKLLLSIPFALIATSFSNVLLQSISEKFQKKLSLLNDLKPVLYVVVPIIIVEIFLISFFGTELFVIFFGAEWGISGEISKILVWSFALNFLVSSFSCIYISMRKIKTYSIWQFFYFTLIIMLMFFRNLAFKDFLKIYVLLEVVAYILISINMINLIYKYEISISKTTDLSATSNPE